MLKVALIYSLMLNPMSHARSQDPSPTKPCAQYLISKSQNAFRTKYLAVSQGFGDAFDTYTFIHFDQMDKALTDAISKLEPTYIVNPRLLENSARTLKKVATKLRERNAMNLDSFSRLSYLYAIIFDFFTERAPIEVAYHSKPLRIKNSSGESQLVSVLHSSFEDILKWAEFEPENMQLVMPFWYGSFKNQNGWRLLPTFANLGFSSILWAMSRGILFTGQTLSPQRVDGSYMWPSRFMGHDYIHWSSVKKIEYQDSFAKFWDDIEQSIGTADLSTQQKSHLYLSLFYLIHEERNLFFECPKQMFDPPAMSNQIYARAQTEHDLGQALKSPMTTEDARAAVQTILNIFRQLCE